MNIDWNEVKYFLSPYLTQLKNVEFTYSNPLFWAFLFLLFLLLIRLWPLKKSFSFSCVLAVILLATTQAEKVAARAFSKPGEPFDPTVVRVLAIILVAFIFVYYAFIKET